MQMNDVAVCRHPALWSLSSDVDPTLAWSQGPAAAASATEAAEAHTDDAAAMDATSPTVRPGLLLPLAFIGKQRNSC